MALSFNHRVQQQQPLSRGGKKYRRLARARSFLGGVASVYVLWWLSFLCVTPKTGLEASQSRGLVSPDVLHQNDKLTKGGTTDWKQMPRLELLHIPKTGGTMLELLAAEHGVAWGACHFEFKWKRKETCPLRKCPPVRDRSFEAGVLWHYPLQLLYKVEMPFDPYDNIPDEELAARKKHFFVVMRNPYTLAISKYYQSSARLVKRRDWTDDEVNDPHRMNKFIQERLSAEGQEENSPRGKSLWLPQSEYVFDAERRMVHHVLHFESLREDFEELRSHYGLNFSVPDHEVNRRSYKNYARLNVTHLSPETLDLINTVWSKDFELGGYIRLQYNMASVF